ncbi:DUF6873 family GME fold protein [Hathewaya limosa]|uniref:DUF6873 domain-containing protein n=1 Tax=Hathewaya limosa TaxID=1536 RepID=A0ABU0JR99_HATLI|nr:hypothetical protein [Hathewaya limosa]MDQ0479608.1 hypothetical protein [Hathewaya limosa]
MKTLFVDNRIAIEEFNILKNLNYKIIKVPSCNKLYNAIKGHPDILLHIQDKNSIIVHKDIPKDFITLLKNNSFNVTLSSYSLDSKYPNDIFLNAVSFKNYFIHNLIYTDPILLKLNNYKKLINVKQGYTKCSTCIVNENSIITSDTNIAKHLTANNFNVLLLPPGDIILEGLDYGFIGGCSGLIEKNVLAFYGDLSYYKYGKEVLNFLKENKVEPLYLRNGKLIDRGSILCNFI